MDKETLKVSKPKTRKDYLNIFYETNDLSAAYGDKEKRIKAVGDKLLNVLKKEDLLYTEAYASLQYCYNKLKFESNFVKIYQSEK